MSQNFYTYIIVSLFSVCDSANILAVFPAASLSHQLVFRPITQELAKRGHNVTVVTPYPAFKNEDIPKNLTEIDLHNISYALKNEVLKLSTKNDLLSQVELLLNLYAKGFEMLLQDERFKKIMEDKSVKYDVLLLEALYMPILALTWVLEAPAIMISSLGSIERNNYAIGSTIHPILYPSPPFRNTGYTFLDRIKFLYNQYMMNNILNKYEALDNLMLKKYFGDNLPSLRELNNNVDMLFLNVHPMWEGNRPVPPNVVYLGGLPSKPNKALPKDLKEYLDSSKTGVIYVSFGTNVNPSLLADDKVQVMMKVFPQLPFNILWKWDSDNYPGTAKNVKFAKWFPQSDLLRHPKIKLLITQGGLQSTDEAIVGGVPVIGIPMLGDQWFNAEKYVQFGIGKRIEFEEIEENSFMEAIDTVIRNDSYRNNVIKLRTIMYDQPQSSLERAIYWTEYVIRHGGARHLRAKGANMPWIEYYQIDIVCFALICVILVCYLIYLMFNFVLRMLSFKKIIKIKIN